MGYPVSETDDHIDVLHGREIADPYRWLEDPDSERTRDWVRRQNAFTEEAFADIPERAWFTELMTRVVSRPRAGTPHIAGGWYFVSRNDGTMDQDLTYVAETLEELRSGGRLILDPTTMSQDGTTAIRGFDVSRDGRYLCYRVSEGGSDWTDFRLLDVATGEPVEDAPIQTKFSGTTWLPDNASYLYEAVPHEGRADGSQAGRVITGVIKLHRVGTPESQDTVVLDVHEEYQQGFAFPELTGDGRYVVVHINEGTEEANRLWVFSVVDREGCSELVGPLRVVDETFAQFGLVRSEGDDLILFTDHEADRGRVVRLDLSAFRATGELNLTDVVPESEDPILRVAAAGDELIVLRLVDVQPVLTRYALDGTELGRVDVSGGAVAEWWADEDAQEWFVGMSTVTSPVRAYRVSTRSGAVEALDDLVPSADGGFEPPEVDVVRRRATSKDGTEVPYFLITPRGGGGAVGAGGGPRPTLLWGYGGFNVEIDAGYRPLWPGWLAAGGTVVIANLRGGAEFGRAWYDGGRLDRKQNVFDDFIAVGEHLVATGVTTHQQLAIHGRSNGGLLVGATMTQRPDLAAVALPAVGVLDMLRFHRFTGGAAWVSDYGDPEDAEDFEVALAYSPVHNVRPAAYPATLVMTGDHDDRVVPAHSHKFTATLQAAQLGDAPVLTRIETRGGHGMGKPLTMVASELADMLAFAAHHTGLQV